jgi:hypothetical protein
MSKKRLIEKIVSGGQSGADRVALDWAILHGIPHGGWCPKGRVAEDGPIGLQYDLLETPSDRYAERTEWNIRDSDGTVIFSIREQLSGGSLTTLELARRYQKPHLHLSAAHGQLAAKTLRNWIMAHGIRVLNVAGPRVSEEPEIARFVEQVLNETFLPDELKAS